MTAIVWDTPSERLYRTGVDRGVLYDGVGNYGVPWNGLISVEENSSGGDGEEYFLDGVKYLDLMPTTSFEATIEAFAAPIELSIYQGLSQERPGLFFADQPRDDFCMSYRTRVGTGLINAYDNSDYEVHLVYGATIVPGSTPHKTLGDDPSPDTKSWTIRTTPPYTTEYRPTSHLILRTKYINPVKMAAIESELYGTTVVTPHLPTQGWFRSYLL
jgi:hypothetical protein